MKESKVSKIKIVMCEYSTKIVSLNFILPIIPRKIEPQI